MLPCESCGVALWVTSYSKDVDVSLHSRLTTSTAMSLPTWIAHGGASYFYAKMSSQWQRHDKIVATMQSIVDDQYLESSLQALTQIMIRGVKDRDTALAAVASAEALELHDDLRRYLYRLLPEVTEQSLQAAKHGVLIRDSTLAVEEHQFVTASVYRALSEDQRKTVKRIMVESAEDFRTVNRAYAHGVTEFDFSVFCYVPPDQVAKGMTYLVYDDIKVSATNCKRLKARRASVSCEGYDNLESVEADFVEIYDPQSCKYFYSHPNELKRHLKIKANDIVLCPAASEMHDCKQTWIPEVYCNTLTVNLEVSRDKNVAEIVETKYRDVLRFIDGRGFFDQYVAERLKLVACVNLCMNTMDYDFGDATVYEQDFDSKERRLVPSMGSSEDCRLYVEFLYPGFGRKEKFRFNGVELCFGPADVD